MSKPANLPEKPPHGSECNGCGQCCAAEPCPLGAAVFGISEGMCPALGQARGTSPVRLVCGLVVAPKQFVPQLTAIHGEARVGQAAEVLTGTGMGCDAQLDGEPEDAGYRARYAIVMANPEWHEALDWAADLFGISHLRKARAK